MHQWQDLIRDLTPRGQAEPERLAECLERFGERSWNRLRELVRSRKLHLDEDLVAQLRPGIAQCPACFFALLLDAAARRLEDGPRLTQEYLELLPQHPLEALATAGYNLHEHHQLLDRRWIAAARAGFDACPAGSWGILTAACQYEHQYLDPTIIPWIQDRASLDAKSGTTCLLALARHWPDRTEQLVGAVVALLGSHPGPALAGTAVACDQTRLLGDPLLTATIAALPQDPESAWKLLGSAASLRPAFFDEHLLDQLEGLGASGIRGLLELLRRLIDQAPGRRQGLLIRYTRTLVQHPADAIDAAYYHFQQEGLQLITPGLLAAILQGMRANAYPAYSILSRLLQQRPELITEEVVEAALTAIPLATNYAFGFFESVLKERPEFTRVCTLALFDCLAQEPVNRAFMREQQINTLISISEAAHVRSGLEALLSDPPRAGSLRAQALMKIMFRQRSRSHRQVLLEALRYAATALARHADRPEPGQSRFTPLWDFMFFIIDLGADEVITAGQAARFLEGAFQLHHLCANHQEMDTFLRRLDLTDIPDTPFPAEVAFLDREPGFMQLHSVVQELARRFTLPARLVPLAEFHSRGEDIERELEGLDRALAAARPDRRDRLQRRRASLEQQLQVRRQALYLPAMADPALAQGLDAPAQALLAHERKELVKHLHDALRSEAMRIALQTVDESRTTLYRERLRELLGRDVVVQEIEPRILPALLWFQAIRGMPNNTRYLRRLIEDRLEQRESRWLRTEPPAAAWEQRVREACPGIHLERWRAPYSATISYAPVDAEADRRRRIEHDLVQVAERLIRAGAPADAGTSYEELMQQLQGLHCRQAGVAESETEAEAEAVQPPRGADTDPLLLREIATDLERIRIARDAPVAEFSGSLTFQVESDPFEILFMGEYGFASCLSLRGVNAWSAVSNAIDIDKTIIWAKERGGMVVARRLIALLPDGVLAFHTYSNRHGLALDGFFDRFIADYAAHCGTGVVHRRSVGPLLSDRWYDDGAL